MRLSNFSLSIKIRESNIGIRTWMIKEAVGKRPGASYFFPSSIQKKKKRLRYTLSPALLIPFYLSSKPSIINFGQLVASSILWFKANFIVRMQSKDHTTSKSKGSRSSSTAQLVPSLCHWWKWHVVHDCTSAPSEVSIYIYSVPQWWQDDHFMDVTRHWPQL